MRVADATIKRLLSNETAMVRESMLAYVDELSDDRVLANDVVTMLEIDGLIVYTGDYDCIIRKTKCFHPAKRNVQKAKRNVFVLDTLPNHIKIALERLSCLILTLFCYHETYELLLFIK